MSLEKHITTRELLRSFKKYKGMLLSGEVMHLVQGCPKKIPLSRLNKA